MQSDLRIFDEAIVEVFLTWVSNIIAVNAWASISAIVTISIALNRTGNPGGDDEEAAIVWLKRLADEAATE